MRLLLSEQPHKDYFLGGLFPLPPPDGFPLVLGALTGAFDLAMASKFICERLL